ncbi:hypothetical protein ACFL4D_00300 [Candidatus Margulisiibacteriota bacterium]
MARNLIIIEFKDEVEYILIRRPELFQQDNIILSLMPEASAALLDHGIKFVNTSDYFSKSSHEQCLSCIDNIINKLNDTLSIRDSYGLVRTYTNALTFYMRQYAGYILHKIEIMEKLIEQNNIQTIYVCGYSNIIVSEYDLSKGERILDRIIQLFADRCSIEIIQRKIPKEILKSRRLTFVKPIISSVYNYVELCLHKLLSFGLKNKKPGIIFFSLKYNFTDIVKHITGCRFYNLVPEKKSQLRLLDKVFERRLFNLHIGSIIAKEDKQFKQSLLLAKEQLSILQNKEKLFSYKGFDFSALIINKTINSYFPKFNTLNKRIFSLKRMLNIIKPAVVISPMSREFSYGLGELCQSMKIASVLISHGSHVPPKNDYDRMEWLDHGKGLIDTDYGYHLLQSPWAERYTQKMSQQKNYINIKPLVFLEVDRADKATKQQNMYPQSKGKKIIVHAGTPKPRSATRFYIYETLDEYIDNVNDLIRAVKDMPDYFLVIRFRPMPDLSLDTFRKLLVKGNHYTIATEGFFADYLMIADLLVSFSSTTIEEALINNIPVLQYDRTDRYVHIDGASWRHNKFAHIDSVYYIGDRVELSAGLQWILDNHLRQTKVFNELFVRHVFHENEAGKAEDFIKDLIRRNT